MIAPSPVYAIAVWQRHRDAFLHNWTSEVGGVVLEPLIILGAIGFGLGKFVQELPGDVSYAKYVAPGIIAAYAMFHALFEGAFGAYMRMAMHRVFDGVLASPVGIEELVLGESLWGASRSIMTSLAVLIEATALGLVSSPWALLAVPVGFLTGLVFFTIALSITAVAPSMGSLNNVFTLIATPMFTLSGVFFPISALPDAMEPVVWALPLTPSVYIIRGLTLGDLGPTHLLAALELVGFVVFFGLLAVRLMRRRLLQ